jgi:hypothetical protein
MLLGLAWLGVRVFGHSALPPLQSPFLGEGPRRTLIAALEVLLPEPARAAGVASDVDGALAAGDPVLGGQLRLALRVLEFGGGGGLFSAGRFSRLPLEERTATLRAWSVSSLGMKRQIFDALRILAGFAWYARPDTWSELGYDGPWVGRPTP